MAGRPFLDLAVSRCVAKRTVIQAGGNAGMYPVRLAESFARVITAEPDPLNFRCLDANLTGVEHVECINAAFGSERGTIAVTKWAPNSGCGRIVPGREAPLMRIDDLGVDDCDMIQLDVEGFELAALMGAMQTIDDCRPLIMLEMRGHGADPTDFLCTMGYRMTANSGTDVIFEALR